MTQPIKVKIMNKPTPIKIKTSALFPDVNLGGETDHSKLKNLDYEHSGHIGFASSEDIPTKVSELENDKSYIDSNVSNLVNYELKGNTGTNLSVSIDNATYVMTISLKNSSGNVISEGTIDLPLESMVISASYDSETKEIVLTLQSGETTRFSVADLVSGLVSQTDFDNAMNNIDEAFDTKLDLPYYFEYDSSSADYEDTTETTLALFNSLREEMEQGNKPSIIIRKGAEGANAYQTYHFVIPQFGTLDTAYIILKGSPIRKDGSVFNVVALNCERDPATNQIKRVYEKKVDGSITIASEPHYVWNGSTGFEAKELFQKVYDAWKNENKILNVDYYRGNTKLKLIGIGNPRQLSNQMLCEFISLDPPLGSTNSVELKMVGAKVTFDTTTSLVTSVELEQHLGDYKLIREYNGSYGALPINNTKAFTPSTDYNPSTKLYTDQRVESIASAYDSTKTYNVGDLVSYKGDLYKNITAIETPESWTNDKWEKTNIVDNLPTSGGEADYYFEYRNTRGLNDTSETTTALFTEIWNKIDAGEHPKVMISKRDDTDWYAFNAVIVPYVGSFGYLYLESGLIHATSSAGYPYWNEIRLTVKRDTTTKKVTQVYESFYDNFSYGMFLPSIYTMRDSRSEPNRTIDNLVLTTANTSSYTPTSDYNPATKKYVDDSVTNSVTNTLTKDNTEVYTPSTPYNPATKHYVDEEHYKSITNYDGDKKQMLVHEGGIFVWEDIVS